jgi:hypothetical protein
MLRGRLGGQQVGQALHLCQVQLAQLPRPRGARRVSPPLSRARAALPAAAGRAHEPRPATPGCLRLEAAQAPSSAPQRGQVSGALIRTVPVTELSQSGEHLKRAARELAGLSQAHARQRCERMQHAAHDRGAAVHVQLRHILSCRQRTSSQLGRLSLPCTPPFPAYRATGCMPEPQKQVHGCWELRGRAPRKPGMRAEPLLLQCATCVRRAAGEADDQAAVEHVARRRVPQLCHRLRKELSALSETKAFLATAQGVAARQCWLGVRAPPCADVAAPLQAASGSGALRLSQHPGTKPVSCQAALVEGDALGSACALAWRCRGRQTQLGL